jgi:hypothetical protein
VACFDPARKTPCAGTSFPRQASGARPLMAVPDADGAVRNVCVHDECWALDGGPSTLPAAFPAFMRANPVAAFAGSLYAAVDKGASRVFFPIGQGAVQCFDLATTARCPGFPVPIPHVYTVRVDPTNANCLWANADTGIITTVDVPTGTVGCKAPPPSIRLKAVGRSSEKPAEHVDGTLERLRPGRYAIRVCRHMDRVRTASDAFDVTLRLGGETRELHGTVSGERYRGDESACQLVHEFEVPARR